MLTRKRAREGNSSHSTQRFRTDNQGPRWDALVFDVLAEILAYFPLAPRMHDVSVVCKRWRSAAVRTVRALSLSKETNVADIYRMFPSLTDLSLCQAGFILLSSSLKSLRLCSSVPSSFLSFYPPFPVSLTHVSFAGLDRDLECVLAFLAKHAATSLTSLDISFGHIKQAVHFPHLTHISLCISDTHGSTAAQATAFLCLHAAQLDTLILRSSVLGEYAAQLHFPSLRHLELRFRDLSTDGAVSRLLSHCTALQTLQGEACSMTYVKPIALLSSLMRLERREGAQSIHPISAITCPNLREINMRLSNLEFFREIEQRGLARYLTAIELCEVDSIDDFVFRFPNVRELTLTPASQRRPQFLFQNLRKLTLNIHLWQFREMVEYLSDFVKMAPSCLTELSVALNATNGIEETLLCPIVKDLSQRGVRKVFLELRLTSSSSVAKMLSTAGHWTKVQVRALLDGNPACIPSHDCCT